MRKERWNYDSCYWWRRIHRISSCKKLKEDGEKVIVFDNFERGHKWAVKGVEVVEGDLRNKEDIKKVFNNFDIEEVYHFAAYSLVGESMQDPMKYFKGNVCGTLNLIDVMTENNVRYIVFSSSAAVYGNPEKIPITEDQPKIQQMFTANRNL